MILLKKLLKNPLAQAILGGLKPCIIGIIFAVGVHMLLKNLGLEIGDSFAPDLTAILIAAGLALVYYGSRKVLKKGISPIGLIGISAVVGVLVYGF